MSILQFHEEFTDRQYKARKDACATSRQVCQGEFCKVCLSRNVDIWSLSQHLVAFSALPALDLMPLPDLSLKSQCSYGSVLRTLLIIFHWKPFSSMVDEFEKFIFLFLESSLWRAILCVGQCHSPNHWHCPSSRHHNVPSRLVQ